MNKVLIAAIGGGAICFASLAQASDLPFGVTPGNYDYPAAFTWTGFYAGINAGGGFGSFTDGGQFYFGSGPSGGLIGGTAGYNYQSGNLMVGVEGDFDWANISSNATITPTLSSSGEVQSIATVRARFGYAADRFVLYGTGGYAGGDIRGTLTNLRATAVADQTFWANGYAFGAGAEYAITPHIIAKAEYIFASLGSNTFFSYTPNITNAGANVNLLRAGLNYKF
jgi:outer membrane immunogenic protein